jgi:hypothetical protein
VHCFVLLGVSSNQLKLNRVATKQCHSISEFRFNPKSEVEQQIPRRHFRQTEPGLGSG